MSDSGLSQMSMSAALDLPMPEEASLDRETSTDRFVKLAIVSVLLLLLSPLLIVVGLVIVIISQAFGVSLWAPSSAPRALPGMDVRSK